MGEATVICGAPGAVARHRNPAEIANLYHLTFAAREVQTIPSGFESSSETVVGIGPLLGFLFGPELAFKTEATVEHWKT